MLILRVLAHPLTYKQHKNRSLYVEFVEKIVIFRLYAF